jgi:hypothetical protein
MSVQSFSVQHRRRRYGRWIAAAVVAVLLALVAGAYVKFAEPAKLLYGFLSGNPSVPGCNTAITNEATAGPLWYRVVYIGCPKKKNVHFVYVNRGPGPGVMMLPALMSIGEPVPVAVRQAGLDGFEIVLEKPLADGSASLPIKFDRNGHPETQSFDYGRRTESKSPPTRR